MSNTRSKNSVYAYALFLIWPFLAFILSFKSFRQSWAKNIVWLFVVFYGYTFVIADDGMDANRYRDTFYDLVRQDYSLLEYISFMYQESDKVDVLQNLLSFFVSKLTDNYHILFATFALFFGYFYSRNIWYLLDKVSTDLKDVNKVLILCFALVVAFWQINGFRFWTATHVFIFGLLPFLYEGKRKYLIVSVLSIFVHFSFVIPVIILSIYLIFGNRTKPYFYFFLVSFFITEINISAIRENLLYLPEVFLTRTEGYFNDEYINMVEERRAGYNWYAIYYKRMFNWSVSALLIVFYFFERKAIAQNLGLRRLFAFTLLVGGGANILANIPSGGRFTAITHLLLIALLFLFYQAKSDSKLLRFTTYLSYPIFALFVLMTLRIGFITISLIAVTGNPFIALFDENDISLIELIK